MQYRNFNLFNPEMLQYMVPMARMKAVSPLLKGSNWLREADLPGIQSIQGEMTSYARRVARDMAARYQQRMKEASFQRATKGFSPTSLISNFIRRK